MRLVWKGKYSQIFYDEAKNYMLIKRTPETLYMTDGDFKKELLEWSKLISKYKPTKGIIDATEFYFVVSPELQVYSLKETFKIALNNGLNKLGIVQPKDFFAKLSVEQLFDKENIGSLNLNFFTSLEKAEQWLFNDK